MNTKTFQDITLENTSALTASYGTSTAGWCTSPLNVRHLDFLLIQFDITWGDGTTITLKLQSSDPDTVAADADDYGDVARVDSSGNAKIDTITIAKADLPAGDYSLKVDVSALSTVRYTAKIDTATGSPAMTMKALAKYPETQRTNPTPLV